MGLEQLPWEQNERSLQVNTYSRNGEDVSSMKERSQTELTLRNLECTKIEPSIAQISAHKEHANTKNTSNEEINLKQSLCKEINKAGVSDKKETVSTHLDEVILSPDILEDNKDLSFFLDLSSPDVTLKNEQSNAENNRTTPETNGFKIKRGNNDLKNPALTFGDRPNKKSRISDDSAVDKNMSGSILNDCFKSSYSRSPSLFDDSLNLDTQMYDILEQNVMDIAHLTDLEDSKLSANKLNATNTSQKTSANLNSNDNQISKENAQSVEAIQSRTSILSWGDDSWNCTEGLLKHMVQGNDQIGKNELRQAKITNAVNTNKSTTSQYTNHENVKPCTRSNKKSACKTTSIIQRLAVIKEKVPHKPKLPKVTETEFSAENKIVSEEKLSEDLHKTVMDDIVVDSQFYETPLSENPTRAKLEKIRKIRSQKISEEIKEETNNRLNSPTRNIAGDIKENKTKPQEKFKGILAQNLLFTANCSSDSVVCNSEDEIKIDSKKSISMTRKQLNTLSKHVNSKEITLESINKKDVLNETTDWNTLNIVKVAKSRATFNLFKREVLKKQSIAIALHRNKYVDNTNNIGSKICTSDQKDKQRSRKSGSYTHEDKEICGAAISWESNIAYYMSFSNSQGK